MIGDLLDKVIGVFSPRSAVQRQHARNVLRGFLGAEQNRLNNHRRPKNKSADAELLGPDGADTLRAWARMLVRDNAYAWGVVDTIATNVVGSGIGLQSAMRAEDEEDAEAVERVEQLNEKRDEVFSEWAEVADINGELTFSEIQTLAQKEMVEAGECLVHYLSVPKKHNGIFRPVPLALELIESDRLATDYDTYAFTQARDGNRVIRGVEVDPTGRPVAYWVYPEHPQGTIFTGAPQPVRLDARNIRHLYRQERIGQTRGYSWFAPVAATLRDLGIYIDNELQASAVASCFTVAIKTDTPGGGLEPPTTISDSVDDDGNTYDYLQPGLIMRLRPHESFDSANPGRPNSSAEPWINLMLKGIAVGTGLSYETVARDYSQTNYSSNRASQQEDRRRYRKWQRYLINHLVMPTWDKFCDAAALDGNEFFPTAMELLESRRQVSAVEAMPPTWEWVDPVAEQKSSELAINAWQKTYADELGANGFNWRRVFKQRAKEEAFKQRMKTSMGVKSEEEESEVV